MGYAALKEIFFIDAQYWLDAGFNSPLLRDGTVISICLNGQHLHHASSRSGSYTVILRQLPVNKMLYSGLSDEYGLSLLRFTSQPIPTIDVRDLELPDSLDISDVKSMAIEERCGVIYLGLRRRLVAVRYA